MLEINDVKINNKSQTLLSIEKMTINKSEFCVVTGASKSGKTLLLNTIHGLYRKYDGQISIVNEEIEKRPLTCMLTENLHLLEDCTIDKLLKSYYKNHYQQVLEYLLIAELGDKLTYKISELNNNEKILLNLCLGCGLNPVLLLIDDFDRIVKKEILEIVGKILMLFSKESGSVLMTSTQKLDEVEKKYNIEDYEVKLV